MKKTYGTYVIKFVTFLAFLLEEFANPLIYITSALVGGTINTVMSGRPFNSVVPYLVPVFVQSFSRASQNFINRLRDRLLELPTERDDPAFIMDPGGNITHSGGKTIAGGDLRGRVYKSAGSQIEISELITVPYQSSVPVLESRKQSSVVLAEYDALRGKRQYKPGFTHEQTCELLAMDDRLKISGADRFGPEIWAVFEKHRNEFARIFDARAD